VFEFYLFESLPKYLCPIPKPSTYPTPSNPAAQHPQAALARVAAQYRQPRSPAAAGRSSSVPCGSPACIGPPAGPAKSPARFPRHRSPAEADRRGPPVIPYPRSSPTRTRPSSAAAARVRLRHDPCAWPARQGSVPWLFKAAPPLPDLLPEPPEPPLPSCAAATETLTRRRCRAPPSSPHRRRGAIQEPRKEVSRPPDACVVDPMRRIVRRSTPDLRRRTDPPPPRCKPAPPRPSRNRRPRRPRRPARCAWMLFAPRIRLWSPS
jgi:hypothetical protein